MSDLKGDVLKDNFKFNILYALKMAKQPDVSIIFRFIIDEYKVSTVEINVFAGGFTFKNVYFGFNTLTTLVYLSSKL